MRGGEKVNIVLSRIDERLIHGQVMTAWIGYSKANRIMIVDDDIYKDDFMKQVLILAAPSNIKLEVYNVEKMVEQYQKDTNNTPAILLFKNPLYVLRLIDKNIKLGSIDLGNMGSAPMRNKVCKNIYLTDREKEILKKIAEAGCRVIVRMLPNDPVKELKDF
ncbi:MAG: Protein-N(pi)-phosphohistidine--sugar phosphotransferase [Clostridia bacterium]|jgi:PTS system mannose-specific IIB component|nr:Protein-N(pi)-phosphohistidine--sugar phosphotransferase [Clostridia bacterium]